MPGRKAPSLVAAVGLAVLCGAADRSLVSAAFGNTIVSTYPDGRTAELWLHPDGGYDAMGRRKDPSSGHWKVKGEKVCLKQKKPIPVPFTYCAAIMPGGVGASWTGKAVTGEPIRIRLVRGRAYGSPASAVARSSGPPSRRRPVTVAAEP